MVHYTLYALLLVASTTPLSAATNPTQTTAKQPSKWLSTLNLRSLDPRTWDFQKGLASYVNPYAYGKQKPKPSSATAEQPATPPQEEEVSPKKAIPQEETIKPVRTSVLTPIGLTATAAGTLWLISMMGRKRDRMLLMKAWRNITSPQHREQHTKSATPFEQELIKSHGKEAAAAIALALGGLAVAAYGIKKS